MTALSDKILQRIRGHGRGEWICATCDLLDLGSRPAVHKALSGLVRRGQLRRVGRGLYDWPQISVRSKQVVPPDLNQAVAAIARRDGVRVMRAGLGDANRLGLTNAVLARPIYQTDGATRDVKVGKSTARRPERAAVASTTDLNSI